MECTSEDVQATWGEDNSEFKNIQILNLKTCVYIYVLALEVKRRRNYCKFVLTSDTDF